MGKKRENTNIYMIELERLLKEHADPETNIEDPRPGSAVYEGMVAFYKANPPEDQAAILAKRALTSYREARTAGIKGNKGQLSLFQREDILPQGDGTFVRMEKASGPQMDLWFTIVTREHRDSTSAYLEKADYYSTRRPYLGDKLLGEVEEEMFGWVPDDEEGEE